MQALADITSKQLLEIWTGRETLPPSSGPRLKPALGLYVLLGRMSTT